MLAAENSCLARMQRGCPVWCIASYKSSILAPLTPKACRTPTRFNEYARYCDVVIIGILRHVSTGQSTTWGGTAGQARSLDRKGPTGIVGQICCTAYVSCWH